MGWKSYLGDHYESDKIPAYAVPALCADLSNLPATWIGVGTADLFFDEDVAYAKRLLKCSVRCELKVVEGAYHGFDEFAYDSDLALHFFDSLIAFVRSVLDNNDPKSEEMTEDENQ